MTKISIIGGGAWGTALAMAARRAGSDVCIQARESAVVEAINNRHENTMYLAGYPLDPQIRAVVDPVQAVAGADAILLVAPAQHIRATMVTLKPALTEESSLVICAKGIEQNSGALLSEIVSDVCPALSPMVLSGPTFAAEVAAQSPTAVTLATTNQDRGAALAQALGTPYFRIYLSDDIIGAQIGGAVKNVLAIACGIVEGRGMGDNTRAALITRGLAEIVRLGRAKGAKAETLMGLSGLGDLTLTCSAKQSRNFSLGMALGAGQSLAEILSGRNSVAEGVFSASSVVKLAQSLNVDVPICQAVDNLLNKGADIDAEISNLLNRPFTVEAI
ncbi:MAG: NAD(P)-dependent glycerol-3-phosphate dehydrogenase [Rhodospirillales bacterium]|nr:NAD(P)-dependent glycerol-3-phosphate dehydrogenase [Rhodospirillales bacterium]